MRNKNKLVTVFLLLLHLPFFSISQVGTSNPQEKLQRQPQTFALVVGVSEYKNSGTRFRDLQYADDDAKMFVEFLKSDKGWSIPTTNIWEFYNNSATSDALDSMLNAINSKIRKEIIKASEINDPNKDRLIIFLAGHGGASATKGLQFFTYDATTSLIGAGLQGFLSIKYLKGFIDQWTRSGVKVILIFDACRSPLADAATPSDMVQLLAEASLVIEEPKYDIVFSASSGGKPAHESDSLGHGIFTYSLLQGLIGLADETEDKIIDGEEITTYVNRSVKNLSKKTQFPSIHFNDKSDMQPFSMVNQEGKNHMITRLNTKNKYPNNNKGGELYAKRDIEQNQGELTFTDFYFLFEKSMKDGRIVSPDSGSAYFFFKKMYKIDSASSVTQSSKDELVRALRIGFQTKLDNEIKGLRMSTQLSDRVIKESKPLIKHDNSITQQVKPTAVTGQVTGKPIETTTPKVVDNTSNNSRANDQSTSESGSSEKSQNQKTNTKDYYKNVVKLLVAYRELSGNMEETKSLLDYFEARDILTNSNSNKKIKESICRLLQTYQLSYSYFLEYDSVLQGNGGYWLDEFISENKYKADAYITQVIAESLLAVKNENKSKTDELNSQINTENIHIIKIDTAEWCLSKAKNYELTDLAEKFLLLTTNMAPYWSYPLNSLGELYYSESNKATQKDSLRNKSKLYFQKAVDINPNDPFPYLNQGDFFMFDRHNYRKALEKYLTAYRKDYKQLKTMMRLSQAYTSLYKFDEAEKFLRLALAYAPENKELLYQAGDFYINNKKDKQKAINHYKLPTQSDPKDVEAWITLGNFYYQNFNTKYDEAIVSYDSALALDSSKYELYQYIGNCYFYKGDQDSAIKSYQKVIELQPNNSLHYLSIGDFYSNQLRNYKKALLHYEKAVELNPDDPNIYYALANVYSGLYDKNKSYEFISKYVEAFTKPLYNYSGITDYIDFQTAIADDYAAAGWFIQNNLSDYWFYAETLHLYAIIYNYKTEYNYYTNLVDLMIMEHQDRSKKEGINKARKWFEKRFSYKQNNANLQYALAYLYRNYLNKPKEAIEYYKKAVKLQPDQFSFVYPEIAACYVMASDTTNAIVTIDDYIENKYPDDPIAWYSAGDFFAYTLNNQKQALHLYEQTVAIDSTFFQGYNAVYNYLTQSNKKSKLNKALRLLEIQARIDPYNPYNFTALANHYQNYNNDILKAVEYYSRAIQLDSLNGPTDALAAIYLDKKDTVAAERIRSIPYRLNPTAYNLNNLAYFYEASLNKPDTALELYSKSYTLDSSSYTMGSIALLYTKLGELDSAEILYKKIIDMNPTEYTHYKSLSWFYTSQKRYEEAVQVLKDGLTRSTIGLQNEYTNPYYDISLVYLYKENATTTDTTNAISNLKKAIETNSKFLQAYNEIGKIYYILGDKETALEWFTKPIKNDPRNPDRYTDAAYQLYYNDDYKSAIKLYKKAIAMEKSALEWNYEVLADCYVRQGKINDAVAVFDRVIKQFPSRKEEFLVSKGEFYKQHGGIAESIAIFKQIIKADYDSTMFNQCVSNLGDAFISLQQYDSAIYYYSILASEDSSGNSLYALANSYWNANYFQKADQLYMKVFKDPIYSSWVDPFTTGKQFQDSGQNEIAGKYFKMVIKNPESLKENLVGSYYYLSEFLKAEAILLELHQQDSTNSETLQWLTLVSVNLNKPEKALEWLKKDMEDHYLMYDPKTHPDLEELRKTSEFQDLMKAYEEN